MRRRHDSHGRGCGRRRGPIGRVIRGLAETFGIPRGMVIAGFVLGFVFVPLWTLVVFLATWCWLSHPATARRFARTAHHRFERVWSRLWRAASGPGQGSVGEEAGREAREPPHPAVDPDALARRFGRIERRARAIEEFVASEEFRLHREFRRMGGAQPRDSR